MSYYFAYGSNMNAERVKKREMPFTSVLAGSLPDYRFAFNKRSTLIPGAASANVVAAKGAVVEGVLYKLSSASGIEFMDPFEGYPVRYDRKLLPVNTAQGVLDAWVYIANLDYIQEGLSPARWYLNHLLAGKAYLSERYFDQLKSTLCLPDSEVEP